MPSGRVPPSALGISTRRDGRARYDPLCIRWCRSIKRSSSPALYRSQVTPSTPAAEVFFNWKNASRRVIGVTWCRSAVSLSFGFLFTACRIRAAACCILTRRCVRRMLWSCGFFLVAALPSSDSAGLFSPLFATFTGTMPASTRLRSCRFF